MTTKQKIYSIAYLLSVVLTLYYACDLRFPHDILFPIVYIISLKMQEKMDKE